MLRHGWKLFFDSYILISNDPSIIFLNSDLIYLFSFFCTWICMSWMFTCVDAHTHGSAHARVFICVEVRGWHLVCSSIVLHLKYWDRISCCLSSVLGECPVCLWVIELQIGCHTWLLRWCWDLSSGPDACMASDFCTEPSPFSTESSLLFCW